MLDQFPRNAFRSQPKAFQADALALRVTKHLISTRQDLELHPIERLFAYMPLEHSEDIQDQEICLEKMKSVSDFCDPRHSQSQDNVVVENEYKEYFQYTTFSLKYAQSHFELIKKFGRFPHRNEILNRKSTVEELEYLENGGETFGASKQKEKK